MFINSVLNTPGSQADFLFEIKGGPSTEVVHFNVMERLSALFECNVVLASRQKITDAEAIHKEALLTVKGGEADRYFHGVIREFHTEGRSGRKYIYNVWIAPAARLLSLEQDCRIFQTKQVQDIITEIFKESGISSDCFTFRLKNKEHKRKYCVQYRETDLDFISRLLEEEGIYYFFEHFQDKHVMVFADDPICYKPIEGTPKLTFKPESGLNPQREVVSYLDFSRRLRPGNYAHASFNFKHASVDLKTNEKGKDEKIQRYEIYDYPGPYGYVDQGKKIAKIRLEESRALEGQIEGRSTCSRLMPGFTFTLDGYHLEALNQEYLIVGVFHAGQQPQTLEEQSGSGSGTIYSSNFLAIPSSVPYRPLREHRKPFIYGIQTAFVVGPQGEEIYTDEYGRIKVQFHWDRKGKKDDKSSCWLRCSQGWGGNGWGMVFLPRIGDEVTVAFMHGDPDWPVIVGSLYNGDKMPLYNLPDHKTRSTIRTRSYPNSTGFNELRFEDKAGGEEIFLHGEKDWNIVIKNDKGQSIGRDETLNVASNRTKSVGVNQSETIGANKTINVGANHTESIGGSMSLSVGNNKNETVNINSSEMVGAAKELTTGGLYQVSVGGIMNETVGVDKSEEVIGLKAVVVGAHMTEYVKGDRKSTVDGSMSESVAKKHTSKAEEYILEATKITLKADSSTIVMDGGSITMKSSKVFQN